MILEISRLRFLKKILSLTYQSEIWIVSVLIFILISCQSIKPESSYFHLSGNAQGTSFSIIYADSAGRDVSNEIDSLFRVIDKSMSLWDSSSIISKINNNQENTFTDIHFQNVFKRSVYYSELTDGAFDMTVGPLVRRWGFYFKKNETTPDSSEIKNLLECVGWKKVKLNNHNLIKSDSCIQIDFNAIAQGYTVDLISEFLEDHKIKNYMVELGGEVRANGINERGELWKIGIDKPTIENEHPDHKRPLQHVFSLNHQSLATSGSYRKYILVNGKKLSHTIDPKSGYPAQHNLLSVSVLSERCIDADALATCFMVLGLEKSIEFAKAHQIRIYCIYENYQGQLVDSLIGNWTE